MALSSKAGAFSIGTGAATTTVAVTGVGFTPKAVIFAWNGRTATTDGTTDPGTGAGSQRGFGVATGTSSRWAVVSTSVDAGTSSAAFSANDQAACLISISAAGAQDGAADLQSFDADGFTLTWIERHDGTVGDRARGLSGGQGPKSFVPTAGCTIPSA